MEPAAVENNRADSDDRRERRRLPLFQAPGRLLLLMAAAIFICETLVMLVLDLLPQVPHSVEAVIDSTILIIILSPTFYLLWFRPFMHHISERRRSEAEIRQLSRKLQHSAEVEARKLSRDLHDEFGQAMAALQLNLENLQRTCPASGEFCQPAKEKLLKQVRTLNERMRNFASALRPPMLDDLGIVPTLEWHIRDFLDQHPHLQVEFRTVGLKRRLPGDIEIVLYRICQEALNNIVKHARAANIGIWLTYSHPKIILVIRDDGTGFDIPGNHGGIGLLGMRERADAAGGRLRVASAPGKGTIVRAELPVVWGEEHA